MIDSVSGMDMASIQWSVNSLARKGIFADKIQRRVLRHVEHGYYPVP